MPNPRHIEVKHWQSYVEKWMQNKFATPEVGCVSAWPSRARNRSHCEEPLSGDLNLCRGEILIAFVTEINLD